MQKMDGSVYIILLSDNKYIMVLWFQGLNMLNRA